MSVVYTTAVKTSRMTATKDYFINGTLELMTSTNVVLATFTLTATAGSVSGAVWTLAFAASTVNATAAGVATKAQIKNSASAASLTGLTVGTSASDIIMVNTNIALNQPIQMTSATVTHPV